MYTDVRTYRLLCWLIRHLHTGYFPCQFCEIVWAPSSRTRGHSFTVPVLLKCPKACRGSSVNPSPQATKELPPCVAYLMAFPTAQRQTIASRKPFFSLSHSLWVLASANTGLGRDSLFGWLAATRDTSQGRGQQGCEQPGKRFGKVRGMAIITSIRAGGRTRVMSLHHLPSHTASLFYPVKTEARLFVLSCGCLLWFEGI